MYRGGLGLATEEDRMSTKNRKVFLVFLRQTYATQSEIT